MTTILMLSAAIQGREAALESERRALDKAIRGGPFRLCTISGFTAEDLEPALRDYCPTILHFSAHGTPYGELCINDSMGGNRGLSLDTLVGLLKRHAPPLRCVYLNVCFASEQAVTLTEAVDIVISASGKLDAHEAASAASTFYRTLGSGRSVEDAYQQTLATRPVVGQTSISLDRFARMNVDPAKVFIPGLTRPETLIEALSKLLINNFDLDGLHIELRSLGLARELNLNVANHTLAWTAANAMVQGQKLNSRWFQNHIDDARETRRHRRERNFCEVQQLWEAMFYKHTID